MEIWEDREREKIDQDKIYLISEILYIYVCVLYFFYTRKMGGLAAKRVLVVDDNIHSCMLAQKFTEYVGIASHNITVVMNWISAVEEATKNKYDIIIMDVGMPGMDGIAASKEIKSHYSENKPKIIAYTADLLPNTQVDTEAFDEIIYKPTDKKRFSQTLFAVLNG